MKGGLQTMDTLVATNKGKVLMDADDPRDLEILLSYILNRQLKQTEVVEALGISRTTYYEQRERGDLISPANLLAAAKYFDVNPVFLLLKYGYIETEHVKEVCRSMGDHESNSDVRDSNA